MPGTRLVHVFTMFWNPPQPKLPDRRIGDWCVGGGASIVDRFMPRSEPLVPPIHVGRGLLLELRWGANKGRRLTAEIFDGNRRVAKVWLHREDAGACMRSL